jgi:alpha-glucosidase
LRFVGIGKILAGILLLLTGAAHAQDNRSVVSPNGQLEFRLFTAVPEGSGLNCLAYQVWQHGRPLLDTSYLGLNIHFQEPLLGENVGLSTDKQLHGPGYNGLWADYLQTSTTGRRIQFEVRVWNDGVAFRYIVPTSPLLVDLLLEDDATQYHFTPEAVGGRPAQSDLPYIERESGVEQESGGAWVGIYEQAVAGFPHARLIRSDGHLMLAHLPDKPHDPQVAFEGKTPWTSPWHILVIGADREQLGQSPILRELAR